MLEIVSLFFLPFVLLIARHFLDAWRGVYVLPSCMGMLGVIFAVWIWPFPSEPDAPFSVYGRHEFLLLQIPLTVSILIGVGLIGWGNRLAVGNRLFAIERRVSTLSKIQKRVVGVAAVVIVFCVGAAVPAIHSVRRAWLDVHPLSDPVAGFTMLQPTALPLGIKITDRRLSMDHDSQTHKTIKYVSAELNFRTEDWVYSIYESKLEAGAADETVTDLRNFDQSSVLPTCTQGTSPKGQIYRLCHWIDYGRISVYEVKNIQQGVYIRTMFPASLQKPITIKQVDSYVDSFKPIDPTGLPILVDAI